MNTKHSACVLLLMLLAACAGEVGTPDLTSGSDANHLGEAVKQNTAAQIANPDAPSDHPLEASGARAANAEKRYRTDTVEAPAEPRTQTTIER
jgi:hypothetical protein